MVKFSFFVLCVCLSLSFCMFLFEYNLMMYFGKDIPWYADVLCGICTNAINLPCAVIAFVLDCCGVATPFFKV